MSIVYGVDTKKPYDAKDVRDAILECFTQAHKNELDETLKSKDIKMTDAEFQKIKEINVRQMVKKYFEEVGGDFENPTKESIFKIMDKLAYFSKNFRNKSVIKKHYSEISQLLNGLK